jgi:hypothetical protein
VRVETKIFNFTKSSSFIDQNGGRQEPGDLHTNGSLLPFFYAVYTLEKDLQQQSDELTPKVVHITEPARTPEIHDHKIVMCITDRRPKSMKRSILRAPGGNCRSGLRFPRKGFFVPLDPTAFLADPELIRALS